MVRAANTGISAVIDPLGEITSFAYNSRGQMSALTNPRGYIPGTAMTFTGFQRDSQRADVINYLHTLADKPLDLPAVAKK